MKCRVQWIDSDGNPTPDDNEAIGMAVCSYQHPDKTKNDSKSLPICAHHRKIMDSFRNQGVSGFVDRDGNLHVSRWTFVPFIGEK